MKKPEKLNEGGGGGGPAPPPPKAGRHHHTAKFWVWWYVGDSWQGSQSWGQPSLPPCGRPHASPAEGAALPDAERPDHTGPNLQRPIDG
jgi:hypothetical protein